MTKAFTDTEYIKMANGKMPLPEGLSRTKYGSYRTQRRLKGKSYLFPNIRNLELALKVNSSVDKVFAGIKSDTTTAELDGITTLIMENSTGDMLEITRQNEELKKEIQELKYNVQTLFAVVNTIHENQNKSFFRRIFNL